MRTIKPEVKLVIRAIGICLLIKWAFIAGFFMYQRSSYEAALGRRDIQIERLQGEVKQLKLDEAATASMVFELGINWESYKGTKNSYEKATSFVQCPRCGMTVRVSE